MLGIYTCTKTNEQQSMEPISPQSYKGIIFIQINMLPEAQRHQFIEWLPETRKIKIQAGNYILKDCVTYNDYKFWFTNFFSSGVLEEQI